MAVLPPVFSLVAKICGVKIAGGLRNGAAGRGKAERHGLEHIAQPLSVRDESPRAAPAMA
jgi:hypothetical protein